LHPNSGQVEGLVTLKSLSHINDVTDCLTCHTTSDTGAGSTANDRIKSSPSVWQGSHGCVMFQMGAWVSQWRTPGSWGAHRLPLLHTDSHEVSYQVR